MDPRLIKVPKVRSQHMDFFEEEELEKIRTSIQKTEKYPIARIRAELFAVMAFSSGMRISEMVKVKVKDVLNGQVNIIGKGDKERVVFFTPECKSLLKKYLKLRQQPLPCTKKKAKNTTEEKRVFISHHPSTFGQQISIQTLAQHNKKYNKNLNIA